MPIKQSEMQAIIKGLIAQGCRVRDMKRRGGWMVYFPDGVTSQSFHATNSDMKAVNAMRARVKRAGLEWPPDMKSNR